MLHQRETVRILHNGVCMYARIVHYLVVVYTAGSTDKTNRLVDSAGPF